MKRPSSKELLSLFGATIAAEGVTTLAGAAAGTSFIDAALIAAGANSFDSMLAVVYPDSPLEIDSFDIVGFVPATGEVQLNHAYKGVAAAIPVGVPYKIVSFRFVPAEVAALTQRTERIEEGSAVYFDSVNGVAGTAYPIGTPQTPVNNVTDLLVICAARGINTVVLLSDMTADAAISGFTLIGGFSDTTLELNGQVFAGTKMVDLVLHGNFGATSQVWAFNCELLGIMTGVRGHFQNCMINGLLTLTSDSSLFQRCDSTSGSIDLTNDGLAELYNCSGSWGVWNLTAGGVVHAYMTGAWLVINASCVGGIINLYGDCIVTGAAAGVTLNDFRTHSYLEQTVPIKMNCLVTITQAGGTVNFIAANATGASGLISTDDTKVEKVFLLIVGRGVNSYAGTNALDCGTATDNQWQIDLDNAGFADLVNEEPDGQMIDNDWRCAGEGIIHPFTFMFDVTAQVTNIDGKIGVRLENAQAEQDSLIVTCDIYLKVVWKL